MDDVTVAKFFQILRSQQILIYGLTVEVQSLIDCLKLLPEFEQSFEKRKHDVASAMKKELQSTLDYIDGMIRELKKSN